MLPKSIIIFVESQVKTVKWNLFKAKQGGTSSDLAIRRQRATLLKKKPCKIRWNCWTRALWIQTWLQKYKFPTLIISWRVRSPIERTKRYHDNTAHILPPLPPKQIVWKFDHRNIIFRITNVLTKYVQPRYDILEIPDESSRIVQIRKVWPSCPYS